MKSGPIILDASAILALLNQEKGYELVEKHLLEALMSTVNISEVVAVLTEAGVPQREAEGLVSELIKEKVDFDEEQAYIAASFRKSTRAYGLSLGDRACLALGKVRNLPVLTADKSWQKFTGVEVRVLR